MSGILFPNLVGTLAPLIQMDQAAEQNAFQRDRIRRADQLDAEDRETGKLFGPALQGDKDAQARLMSSRHAPALLQQLERVEVGKRAKAKEDADYITGNGMAILNAPADQQPGLYARVRQEAAASGRDVSTWPTTYDPGWVQFNVNKAMSVKDHFDRLNNGPQAMPPPGGGAMPPAGPDGSVIGRASAASKSLESQGGPNGGYGAIGPIANKAGNRAYGAHQVMDFNIGPWTQEVLGQAMTPQQFLASPQAQDAVYKAKMGQYIQKYGSPEAASRAWFAGEGGMNNRNATDVLGTSVQGYGQRFAQAYGDGAMGSQPTIANAAPMPGGSGAPPGMAVGDTRPQADASGNPLPPPAQAPGAAGGIDIDGLRKQLIAGGGDLFTDPKTGQTEMQNGYYVVRSTQNPRQIIRLIPAPKPKDDKGRYGDTLPGRMFNDLSTFPPDSREYATARAFLSKPHQVPDGAGGFTIIQPMDLSMYPPATYGSGGGQPAPSAPAPGGPVTTQIPGGGSMTSIPGKGKPLDNSSRDDLTKASGGVLALTELVKSFDPAFGGYMYGPLGDADNFRKRSLPDMLGGKDEKGQAQWWQRYQDFANLERNKLFGAALTPGETAEFNKAMINPGMKPDQITANLSRQRDVAAKALSRVVNSMVESGYNPAAIEAAMGIKVSDLPSPMGAVPQAQPGATQPPAQGAPKPPADNAERGRLIFDAQKAIKEGRDPVAVRARLKQLGVDPVELDAK